MFRKLTSECVLLCLTTAPPHLTTKLRLMDTARPVEIGILSVLAIALLANYQVFSLSSNFKFQSPLSKYFILFCESLVTFLQFT